MRDIAYYMIWNRPLVLYVGVVAVVLMVLTLVLGKFRIRVGSRVLGVPVHRAFAIATSVVVLVHLVMALSVYIN